MLALRLFGRLPRTLRLTLAAGVVLALGSLGTNPDDAQAQLPAPIGGLGGAIGHVITGGVGSAAVDGFGALLSKLFSWPADIINRKLLTWLVAVPDYAISPRAIAQGGAGSNLAELASTTSSLAFAALAAAGTVAGLRYWAAGLSGNGGFEALEGLGRMVGAALFVVAWPWLFRHCADLSNAAARALLSSGTVIDDTNRLLGVAFAATVTLNFLQIIIAAGAGVLFLGLLMCKVVVSASTALVFVGMPLAVVAWVIPELAWITRAAMRAFAVVLAIPLMWALCFATFAAVGMDALALKGAGSVADSLIMPLVALALLWVTLALPRTLARMALLGGMSGGGFVSRTSAYVVGRRAGAAISQGAPNSVGGSRNGDSRPSGTGQSQSQRRPSASSVATVGAAVAVAGPAGASAAAGSAGTSGAPAVARAGAASGGMPAAPKPAASPPASSSAGLHRPSWPEVRQRDLAEVQAAKGRRGSTSRGDVVAAMRKLDSETQQNVRAMVANTKPGKVALPLAHQAARTDLGEPEREAFRTLASATPQTRQQGLDDFFATQGQQSSEPVGPSASGAHATGVPERPSKPPATSDAPNTDHPAGTS